jgi:N-acetyl sugar amidotransferase
MILSKEDKGYRQCSISVMDNIADPAISFDEKGICNYYYEYLKREKEAVHKGEEGEKKLAELVAAIKEAGKGKKYDCITGVSGGVDSTYLSLQAKKLGLNPLIIHFDNGWNSELAVKNIEEIIGRLNFDLYTLVVNWEEFKDIQLSFIKASVVDIETVTDHAIFATLYKLAVEHNIKYILSGTNVVTEATLPPYWIYRKSDHINIIDIHKKFGTVPIKTYPLFTTRLKKTVQMKGIKSVDPLNYMPYIKADVKKVIAEELGWKDYGGKHYESIFTRFYQGYILPTKFGIDKRKAHLSNLIFSGQISKEQAVKELAEPIYNPEQLKIDKEFVLKKLDLSETAFDDLMKQPRKEHTEYDFEKPLATRYPVLKPISYMYRKIIKVK